MFPVERFILTNKLFFVIMNIFSFEIKGFTIEVIGLLTILEPSIELKTYKNLILAIFNSTWSALVAFSLIPLYVKFLGIETYAIISLYATLNLIGKLNDKDLSSLRKINSKLQGHPDRKLIKDIHAGTGALGQGLSMAIGFAIAEKLKNTKKNNIN